jgi:uncharacterized protein YkwD
MRIALVLAAMVALGPVPYSSELQFCADQTNVYRASVGMPALTRSEALDAYAATSARVDAESGVAHRYFDRTDGGGIALAENLVPWWPLSRYGSVREVVRRGLAGMWAEGSGGAHYKNIVGRYSEIGCGIYSDGTVVTVVQAFR